MPGLSNDGQLLSPMKTLEAVRGRLTEAVLSRIGFNHPSLVAEIRRKFGSADVNIGALAQEPVIEAALPYLTGNETLAELSGNLLHPKVIDALTIDEPGRQYAFPRDLKPYAHQIEAWRLLRDPDPQSVLVTSGTGSGKTECFVLPMLDDLAREVDASGRLSGVRVIALYPLNALIASQEERLREWTKPFGDKVRFGLYNGNMPEDSKSAAKHPEQVEDRRTLRADPPPILVTNVTMLEYMTVRKQDRPLIEASRGKLRWIILDEAHSYVGSRAAEIALLIRRVLLTFGVNSNDIRFVATSATIGEGVDVEKKLKAFLRDVAGVAEDRVHVVVGQRRKPSLPAPSVGNELTLADAADPDKLASNPVVQNLIRLFDNGPMKWTKFESITVDTRLSADNLAKALAARNGQKEPLLPMRAHGFIRGIPGIWSCLNPDCADKPDGWPFGAILPEAVQRCPHCESTVLEIERCNDCDEPFLNAVEREGRISMGLSATVHDEFVEDSESEAGNDQEGDDQIAIDRPDIVRLISVRPLPSSRPLHVDPKTGDVKDVASVATVTISSHERGDACPACGGHISNKPNSGELFRKFRAGAPFLIGNAVPVLLDGVAPRDNGGETQMADKGRQILSFTDSRQGTARFAASLQNGSERNFIRAAIYHAVQDTLRPDSSAAGKIVDLDAQIAALEPIASSNPRIEDILIKLRRDRSKLTKPAADGISWPTLREQLSNRPEIDVLMRSVWKFRDERFLKSSRDFSEFLILRELARRPRKSIALETLGLARLRFIATNDLDESRLPRIMKDRKLSLHDWSEFLHILISLNVRAPFAIRTEIENIHWMSGRFFVRGLIAPGNKESEQTRGRWPFASGRSVAVKLLERVLGLNPGESHDQSIIDDILVQAWNTLLPLFTQPGAGGYYALDFNKMNITPVTTAYLCPVTRRLTDTVFRGLSPYGVGASSRFSGDIAESFDMPIHPNPFLLREHGGAEVVHEWLADDPNIAKLRDRRLWTNLHDRIALESPYFRAAEHSAQQPPARLRFYEKEFKEGRINVLNCSTTMEMGVDIGSVSTVMMTNVPPSVANYRQRVGRAGRRGQGFALALTYARTSPLDRETFHDPVGYLNRRIEAPKVTLDSRRIVQRHVNALLLATWFRSEGGEALKAKVGEFFGCPPVIGKKREPDSPAAHFQEWAQSAATITKMTDPIGALVRGSALAGDSGVFKAAGLAMKTAEANFVLEWEAVQAQADSMDREAAKKSLGFQLTRMSGESLLGELADCGVLPGHGFPTDVVSFVNKDKPDKDDEADGADNRFRRRNYPSRNLDVAIRDYAPGAEVVIDGLVYESAGVTLNWKRPAGESDLNEIQSLKWHWECRHCGDAGTNVLRPETCKACDTDIEPSATMRFLKPAGFTVDMTKQPHADIDEVSYVEPEPERVSVHGSDWQPLLDASHGRVRSSSDGMVFYSSRGSARHGYSVCLECGRAEADLETAGGPAVVPLEKHRPLRFTKVDSEGLCPGNARPFSIQSGLALGHEISTDVVEIQPANLTDMKAAWALGSALREALSRRLGVESAEMGIAIEPRETSIGGITHSVMLYDRAAGGAGFAPRLIELFVEILSDARDILNCSHPGCITGCSACVLTSDLASKADTLDRTAALTFLDSDLAAICNPESIDEAAHGAMLAGDVVDEILAQPATPGQTLTIWPSDGFDAAGLSTPRIRLLMERSAQVGRKVVLCFDQNTFQSFDASEKLGLRDSAIRHGFAVAAGPVPKYKNGATAIAALSDGRTWATRDAQAGSVDANWGIARTVRIVWFHGLVMKPGAIDLDTLLPERGTKYLEVTSRLDGPIRTIGDRFVALLKPALTTIGLWKPKKLVAIEYSDRYVNSPLAATLAIKTAEAMAKELGGDQKILLRLRTAPLRLSEERTPNRMNHDWRHERDRHEFVDRLSTNSGLKLQCDVGQCAHSRSLRLIFAGTDAVIVMDQGFGFLKTQSAIWFDFALSGHEQERKLKSVENNLVKTDGSSYFVLLSKPTGSP
jgi:DEAD/DEAH box helicase domain-containing protein